MSGVMTAWATPAKTALIAAARFVEQVGERVRELLDALALECLHDVVVVDAHRAQSRV
jgi:hypothetical protein